MGWLFSTVPVAAAAPVTVAAAAPVTVAAEVTEAATAAATVAELAGTPGSLRASETQHLSAPMVQ